MLRDARHDEALRRPARCESEGLSRGPGLPGRRSAQPGARLLHPREQVLRPEPRVPARDRLPPGGRRRDGARTAARSRGEGLSAPPMRSGGRRGLCPGVLRAALLLPALGLAAGCTPRAPSFDPDTIPEAYHRATGALMWPGATRAFLV